MPVFRIKGYQYTNIGEKVLQNAPLHAKLKLTHEPENKYDENAIAVSITVEELKNFPPKALNNIARCDVFVDDLTSDIFLGYIDRTQNKVCLTYLPCNGELVFLTGTKYRYGVKI